jgi:hypothetical protein
MSNLTKRGDIFDSVAVYEINIVGLQVLMFHFEYEVACRNRLYLISSVLVFLCNHRMMAAEVEFVT